MEAVPAASATFEHAGGDDPDGCLPCWNDQYEQDTEPENITACLTPTPDPAEPGVCQWCSHAVVAVVAPASLPCPGCESSPCGCPS